MNTKKCIKCGKTKSIEEFGHFKVKKKYDYVRKICTRCMSNARIVYNKNHRFKQTYQNCVKFNKLFGIKCDFSPEFVENIINQPCAYCDDNEVKIGLDRIDNDKPYSKHNIVPCCIRCNYIKRDMPTRAWNMLHPEIKKIREQGLFGSWCPRGLKLT